MKKKPSIKKFLNPDSNFSEVVDLLEDEDIEDEDIARDMNLDLETVRSLKQDIDEDILDGPSALFKAFKIKKTRRKL
jgi:hypothetical protein